MVRRKSIIGLCLLCSLAISGLVAQSASAVFTGTTAFTCKEVATGGAGTKGFKDAHCKEKAEGTAVKFEHKDITNDETTDLTVSNETTAGAKAEFAFHSTITGVELELKGTQVSGTGEIHNHLNGEEHQATGTATIKFENVKVPKPAGPKGEKCIVKTDDGTGTPGAQGVVDAKVKATTAGQGMALKLEPDEGTQFAGFWIQQNPANEEKCPATLVKTYSIIGSIKASKIEGATLIFERGETTTQGTLRIGSAEGPKAGIDGRITLSAKAKNEEKCTPLALTTTGEA